MTKEDSTYSAAYDLCEAIGMRCSCKAERRDPCDAILDMLEAGDTAADESRRIARECGRLDEWF